jgi:hypothetical protein
MPGFTGDPFVRCLKEESKSSSSLALVLVSYILRMDLDHIWGILKFIGICTKVIQREQLCSLIWEYDFRK